MTNRRPVNFNRWRGTTTTTTDWTYPRFSRRSPASPLAPPAAPASPRVGDGGIFVSASDFVFASLASPRASDPSVDDPGSRSPTATTTMAAVAAAAPAQHQPSMPLLLLVEQTVLREIAERRVLLDLAPVKTEDGRVSFLPTLTYTKDTPGQLSMSLQDCECTEPCMVLCRMVAGHYRRTQDQRPDAVEEARVILHSDQKKRYTLKSVVTVRYGASSSFKKVTILLQVYDIVCPRPSTGAGLHLNRARMEGTLCDVKLVVEGVELPAHRTVLALRSPVLSNMLTGDFKEARDGRVELVDFSSGAVAKFLEFLYTDQIGDWANSELELLQLSDKYMVPELRSECALRLWSCDPLRALEVLHAAGLCDTVSGPLRRRLTATVVENHKILADTEQWAVFSATYPVLVDTMLGPGSQPSDAPVSVWSL